MSDYELLETIRAEIHAEHSLISHRMAWYVTSESFLMTAYAISSNDAYWREYFRIGIPILGALISALAFIAIRWALVVQSDVIKTQEKVLQTMIDKEEVKAEKDRLVHYGEVTCFKRQSGEKSHRWAMMPSRLIPIIFFAAWVAALYLNASPYKPQAGITTAIGSPAPTHP